MILLRLSKGTREDIQRHSETSETSHFEHMSNTIRSLKKTQDQHGQSLQRQHEVSFQERSFLFVVKMFPCACVRACLHVCMSMPALVCLHEYACLFVLQSACFVFVWCVCFSLFVSVLVCVFCVCLSVRVCVSISAGQFFCRSLVCLCI